MTGSTALDVVIGLVFIYLIYSLLATVMMEGMATWLGFRAKNLQQGISRLLNDEIKYRKIRPGDFARFFKKVKPKGFAGKFYAHPSIKYLAENKYHSKPSYITATSFASVIIDLLRGEKFRAGENNKLYIEEVLYPDQADSQNQGQARKDSLEIQEDTLKGLRFFWVEAQGDITKFKALLEEWYEDAQARITGWYKRYTQVFLFVIGLGVAWAFNVDTIQITNKLSNDPKATAKLVEQAGKLTGAEDTTNSNKSTDELLEKAEEALAEQLKSTNAIVGLGWDEEQCQLDARGWAMKVLGFFLTAMALSLGAPFWFDILNRLMSIRGSAKFERTNKPSNASALESKVDSSPKRVG